MEMVWPCSGAVFGSLCSNLGDASPETRRPFCANTGLPCDYGNSSCPIGGEKCVLLWVQFDPAGSDMFDNTWIIRENIYKSANDLLTSSVPQLHRSDYKRRRRTSISHKMTWPLPCHPNIVDVQMITTGPVAIVTIPGEIITMPGRTREAIKHELQWEHSVMQRWSSLACVASTHYTITYKEYQIHHLCIYPEV